MTDDRPPVEIPPQAPPVWAEAQAARARAEARPKPATRTLGIASLIAGLIACCLIWTGLVGAGGAALALVLAACSLMRGERPGFAIAGLLFAAVGLALSLTWWAAFGITSWLAHAH